MIHVKQHINLLQESENIRDIFNAKMIFFMWLVALMFMLVYALWLNTTNKRIQEEIDDAQHKASSLHNEFPNLPKQQLSPQPQVALSSILEGITVSVSSGILLNDIQMEHFGEQGKFSGEAQNIKQLTQMLQVWQQQKSLQSLMIRNIQIEPLNKTSNTVKFNVEANSLNEDD